MWFRKKKAPTPTQGHQAQGSQTQEKRKGNLNMGIARAHELATQIVGVQLAAANFLAITVSACSIVAGTVTYAVINQPGVWPIWIPAGAIGMGLAILIAGMTLVPLITIPSSTNQIPTVLP